MSDDPDRLALSEAHERQFRRVRRSGLWCLALVVVVGGEHWIRGDDVFPLWIFVLLGAASVWVLVSFELIRRNMARRARRDD